MRTAAVLVLALSFIAACNDQLPPAPAPPAQPAPFVVGRWLLDGPSMSERLYVNVDGTFTEGGGPPLGADSLSPILSSGTWAFAAPMLTFDDARTGVHAFDATVIQGGDLILSGSTHEYRFQPEATDAGTD